MGYEIKECKECQSDNLKFWDSGREGKYNWEAYKCLECDAITTNEP